MTTWHLHRSGDGTGPTPLGEFDLTRLGYLAEEQFLSGDATSYRSAGEHSIDGRWTCEPDDTAPFTTRLLICRPDDPERFNGTVVVEWLNVSAGTDIGVGWVNVHRQLMRSGAAYVGVSAQRAGIEGGGLIPGPHLKLTDPARYHTLQHPGDAFAFDIFSQAGQAIRAGGPLEGSRPERLIAVGASQSAVFLVTYVNAIDPLARVFDGYEILGRGGSGAPLDGQLLSAVDLESLGLEGAAQRLAAGHHIRADARVPVIIVQSETDQFVLSGLAARQPDSDRIRTWEIAGAAHGDTYGLVAGYLDDGSLPPSVLAKLMTPLTAPMGLPIAAATNSGPQQHYVQQAALAQLEGWIRDGDPPPVAPPLESDESGLPARDALGIAKGGVRTPWVEAPAVVLSGVGAEGAVFGILFGTTVPIPMGELLARYPGGAAQYREQFAKATRDAVAAGFLLAADEDEIVGVGAAQWPFWPLA